jgi:serine/threonine-protein kinase
MAPEQWLHGEHSERSDLYAVGLVLYEMFTGRPLHGGRRVDEIIAWHRSEAEPEPPSQFVDSLPAKIEALILQCLKGDPSQRPASVGEVLAALEA